MSLHYANEELRMRSGRPFADFVSSFSFPHLPGCAAWVWEPAQDIAAYSDEWRSILDLPPSSSLGTSIDWLWNYICCEDRALFRDACLACAHGRTDSLDITVRMAQAGGFSRWLLFRGAVVADCSRPGRFISGTAIDVSRLHLDRPFLAHAISQFENYQSMASLSSSVSFRFERYLFPLYTSLDFERHLGVFSEKARGELYEEFGENQEIGVFVHRNVAKVFASACVIKETAAFPSVVHGEVAGEFCFLPEFGSDGNVSAVICHLRDMTKQLLVEREMQLSKQRFSALHQLARMHEVSGEECLKFVVEQMAIMTKSQHSYLYLRDIDGCGRNRMNWSESVYRKLEPRKPPTDKIPPGCFIGQFKCETSLRSPLMHNSTEEFSPAFDTLFVRRYMVVPLIENGQVVCIASVCNKETEYTDYDMRQLELFLTEAMLVLRHFHLEDELKKEGKSPGSLLAAISHELRTPLNGILSMLQILELSPLTEEQLEYVRTASLSGKSLLRILSDISDYSRLQSGKTSLQCASFDLRATLLSIKSLFACEARQRGLTLSASIDENLPSQLWGDDARVRQIILNLVSNAMKYTEQGSITVECSLLPYKRDNTAWVYLSVADTGIGIPKDSHDRIFEAFTQVSVPGKSRYTGSGLGLGIVKNLILFMGGSLALDSQVGEGTHVHCSLPLSLPAPAVDAAFPATSKRTGKEPARRLDILVAEDDPVGQFAIRTMLERAGHRVCCVASGMEALEALQVHLFDCLITDIQMPVMDGLETVRRVRQGEYATVLPSKEIVARVHKDMSKRKRKPESIPRDLPIVALTAHAMSGDQEHFLRMGMDLYLSKPIIMGELQGVLQQVLQRKVKPSRRTVSKRKMASLV